MWISIWSKFEIRKFKEKKKEEKAWDQSIYPVSERIGPTMKHIY